MTEYTADIEATFTLKIRDEAFEPGRVRVHIPAPINAAQLSEGQILDFDPMFRIVSVEDYPQRSIWFDEVLEANTAFTATFAFTNTLRCITPDLDLINRTEQPGFTQEQLERFASAHSCDCGSYTGPAYDRVTMMDLSGEAHLSLDDPDDKWDGESDGSPCSISSLPYGDRLKAIFMHCASENISGSRNLKFVRMCRRYGIPARWQGGILCRSADDPISSDWAIAYAAPYGWFFVDAERCFELSTGKTKKTGRLTDPFDDPMFYFGGLDPYRMPTASKYGAGLYPAKDFLRADMMTNVRGEVEYAERGLGADEFTTSVEFRILR